MQRPSTIESNSDYFAEPFVPMEKHKHNSRRNQGLSQSLDASKVMKESEDPSRTKTDDYT